MNCQDIMERLGEYRDLADHDPAKAAIDRHIGECDACRAEFLFWQESAELIRTVNEPARVQSPAGSIAGKVMARIYEDDPWRKPVALHTYSFSWRVRRNIMACFAMCLAIFFVSFLYSLVPQAGDDPMPEFAIKVETAVAKGQAPGTETAMFMDAPVVSIGSTVLLVPGTAKAYANYYLAASIAGVVATLLLMNWLSRLRA